MAKPAKPTDLEEREVLQRAIRKVADEYKLATTASLDGVAEVEISAVDGDSVAIGDDAGNKAVIDTTGSDGNAVRTSDQKNHEALTAIYARMAMKPKLNYDTVTNTLTGAGTIETYLFKLSGTTQETWVVTYDDATRARWNNIVVS